MPVTPPPIPHKYRVTVATRGLLKKETLLVLAWTAEDALTQIEQQYGIRAHLQKQTQLEAFWRTEPEYHD